MSPALSSKNVALPGQSRAAQIERSLAVQIIRGDRTPGSQLPPVRALATEFAVAVPTVQRAVDRLEAAGLVTVRRGSGITVGDPMRCGDISLLPVWFEALADTPDRVVAMLEDFLGMHRVVAVDLIRRSFDDIVRAGAELVDRAAAVMAAETHDAAMNADLAFTRAVIESTGQFAALLVFNTAEQLVRSVPLLSEAYYGDRAYHRRMVRDIAGIFAKTRSADDCADAVGAALTRWDRRCAKRFRALLEG